ncbi:MAG: ABC transporter permease [Roseococcus sp.]|jgi:capsular polysaccharide transport system permease protein
MTPRGPRAILEDAGFWRAARVQMGVIGALILREIQTRFGRRNLGFVWLFVEPAILAAGVSAIRAVRRETLPAGMDPVAFFTIGYTLFYLQRAVVARAAHTAESNRAILAHARITLEDILIARTVLETGAVMMTALIFVVLIGVFSGVWPRSVVQMGIGFVLFGLMAHGFALVVLSLARFDADVLDRIIHPLMYFSIVISGVFFMVWWLPKPYQDLVLLLPLIHLFEFVREGQFGPDIPYHYDLVYVGAWILGLNVYGGLALRRARPFLLE